MNAPTDIMSLRKTSFAYVTALLLLATCGCQLQRCNFLSRFSGEQTLSVAPSKNNVQVLLNSRAPNARPGRVVLVASGRGNGNYQAQRKIIRELAVQFRTQGVFEVVVPDDLLLYGHSDNILQGKFDEAELATISRKFNSDAVVVVRVNEFRSLNPMRVGVALAIIDSAESIQTLGAEGVWDLADTETNVAFDNFLLTSVSVSPHEQRIRHQAPTWLFQFSATQMVEAIVNSGF